MIDIKSLTQKDIGRWVIYTNPSNKKQELGKLKSFKTKGLGRIYVVYKCKGEWNRFKDFTGVATGYMNLDFADEESKIINKEEVLYGGRDYEGGNE